MTQENISEKPKYDIQQGCSVDWDWLKGRTIASAVNDLQNLIIEFEDGLTFRVQALNYQAKPFLAFTPYQNPEKREE